MRVYSVRLDNLEFEVSFDYEHFRPAVVVEGKYRPIYISDATTCTIRAINDPEVPETFVKERVQCSTKDKYSFVGGSARALDRAVRALCALPISGLFPSSVETVMFEFHAQVLPLLEHRMKQHPDLSLRQRHRLALRALRAIVNEVEASQLLHKTDTLAETVSMLANSVPGVRL